MKIIKLKERHLTKRRQLIEKIYNGAILTEGQGCGGGWKAGQMALTVFLVKNPHGLCIFYERMIIV